MAFIRGEEWIFAIFENFNSIIICMNPTCEERSQKRKSFMGKGGWKVEHDHCCDFNGKVEIQSVGAETVSHLAEHLEEFSDLTSYRKDLLRKD